MKRENSANSEIRQILRLGRLTQGDVANQLGVALGTVNKRLRLQLPENEAQEISAAVGELLKDRRTDIDRAEELLMDLRARC